jgi:hypothetical protein
MNNKYSSPTDMDHCRFLQALDKLADNDLLIQRDWGGHLGSPCDWSIFLLRNLQQKEKHETSRNA